MTSTPIGRRALFAALYFSEGAPIGFLWWALPVRMGEAGVPIDESTALTAALVLPWAFKALWSPLIDLSRARGWSLRLWIVSAQIVMSISLAPLLWLDLAADLSWVWGALLVHAFAAATQDAAIDTLAISSTPPRERGALNGWMQVGMLAGRSIFGGGVLVIESRIGPSGTVAALAATILLTATLVVFIAEPPHSPASAPDSRSATGRFRDGMLGLLQPLVIVGAAFALVGGASFEAVGAVATRFLSDRGFERETVGRIFTLPIVLMMAAGALAGGRLVDRVGRIPGVKITLATVALAVVMLATVDAAGSSEVRIPALLAFYLAVGAFTASSYALFMDLASTGAAATRFSLFMGLTNACEAWAGWLCGSLVARFGYPSAFLVMATFTIPAVALVFLFSRMARTRA